MKGHILIWKGLICSWKLKSYMYIPKIGKKNILILTHVRDSVLHIG